MITIIVAPRSSKITVECTGMSARQLPVGIDRVTQVRLTKMENMMVIVVVVVVAVVVVVVIYNRHERRC